MISVPQLLVGVAGLGVAVGALATYAMMSVGKRSGVKVKETSKGSKVFAPIASPKIKRAAKMIRWYTPAFSPKNVPRFYDVSSFTEDPDLFQFVIDVFVDYYNSFPASERITCIVGVDARGFVLGPPIALALKIKCVLLRKDQKNPGVLVEGTGYTKEYKEAKDDKMCLRLGTISPNDRCVVIDDLLATGGTAMAGMQLVQALGATCSEFATLIALEGLDGISKIRQAEGGRYKDVRIFTLLTDEMVGEGTPGDPTKWDLQGRMVPLADAAKVQAKHKTL